MKDRSIGMALKVVIASTIILVASSYSSYENELAEPRVLLSLKDKRESNQKQRTINQHPIQKSNQEQAEDQDTAKRQVNNQKDKDQQSTSKETQTQLQPQWHLYFAAMILSTLLGMRILRVWEEKIHNREVSPSNSPNHSPPLSPRKRVRVRIFDNQSQSLTSL